MIHSDLLLYLHWDIVGMSLFQIQRIELAVLPTLSLHPGELHDVIIPGLGTYSPHVIVHGALRVHKHLLPAKEMKMLDSYHSTSSSIKLKGFNQVILFGKTVCQPISLPCFYFRVGHNMSSRNCDGVIWLLWRGCIHDNRVRGHSGYSSSIILCYNSNCFYKSLSNF